MPYLKRKFGGKTYVETATIGNKRDAKKTAEKIKKKFSCSGARVVKKKMGQWTYYAVMIPQTCHKKRMEYIETPVGMHPLDR